MVTFIAAAAWAGSPIASEQPGGANLSVAIDFTCGSLVVRGSDLQTVRVGGTVEDPDALHVASSPGRVSITVDSHRPNRSCADLVVEVPTCTAIDAELINASVSVDGVTGAVDLQTVSGSISVSGTPARIDAASISGEVRATGAVRRVQVETVSGSITLAGVGGSLELSSVSGQIRVDASSALDALTAETVSGPITVGGVLAPQGRIDLESHAGQLTVGLPTTTNAILSWSTFGGHVSNAFGAGEDRELRLGTGDGRVELETFAGGIAITRRD